MILFPNGRGVFEWVGDWEYRISGGRESARSLGHSTSDAEDISAFMWLKVHQNLTVNLQLQIYNCFFFLLAMWLCKSGV